MGVRFPGAGNTTIVNAAVVTTAETIIAQWPSLSLALDFQQVLLFWYLLALTGTATTQVTMRIRRGPLVTSPVVNIATPVAEGAGQIALTGLYVDTPGAAGGLVYSLTFQATAATGNATINDVCVATLAL